MNKEEKLEKIKHMKSYFFVSFLVSFVFLLFASMMCIVFQNTQIMVVEKFFGLDAEDYGYILVLLMGFWKIIIIQFTLIPAIVLAIIEKHCHCCKCK